MVYKVFVDGQEGTTGLEINGRLQGRSDIELLKIAPEKRKDIDERKKLINEADIVFLCLPDDAARSRHPCGKRNTRIIDASTAHRTNDLWAYGFPELSSSHGSGSPVSEGRSARLLCNGFHGPAVPAGQGGHSASGLPVTCHAVSGYSGGGKKRIAEYAEADPADEAIKSPRFYALTLKHKHLPEMQKVAGLSRPPLFTPIIGYNYRGMTVAVPLHSRLLPGKDSAESICDFFCAYDKGQHFIKVFPYGSEGGVIDGFLGAAGCNGTNMLEIYVAGNEEHILLTARLDNLGKGASGAAVQCMNIMMGIDERTGLE